MPIANTTPYAAIDLPLVDPHGREVVVVVVKATFDVAADGRLTRSAAPVAVCLNDVMTTPDDPRSSVRYPSDAYVSKRGCDLVVVGQAVSRTKVKAMDVCVKAGAVTAPLRVHGERMYVQAAFGVAVGPSAAFETMSITYERAFGGMTDDCSIVEHQNPSGVGVAKSKSDLVGRPAPQIEHPREPLVSASDRPRPMGYGATRPHWSPRREHAGTFDAAWVESRMPLMPRDFDARFNNVAHPSLLLEEAPRPGDAIAVVGMTLRGTVAFAMPELRFSMRGRSDVSGVVEGQPIVDTILVEPNPLAGSADARAAKLFPTGADARVSFVTRRAFALGRGRDILREVRVDSVA